MQPGRTQPVAEKLVSRRDCLRRLAIRATVAYSAVALSGCTPFESSSEAELVWGRRGLSEGRFLKPRAISIDRFDQLYICDTTGRIQVFDRDGNWLRQWSTPETANGRPTGMTMWQPDPDGAPEDDVLLVADTHYYRMLVYTREGERRKDLEIGGEPGVGNGEFAFVTDAIADKQGNFYISEYGDSDRIQKFAPDGTFLYQWNGSGTPDGRFRRPQSLDIDGDVLWVTDALNHRIQRFSLKSDQPEFIDSFGKLGSDPGQFHYPYGLFVLEDGGAMICEYGNQRITRVDAGGAFLGSWGTPGVGSGQLDDPWSLVVDSQDRVHVLDSENHRIQRTRLPGA